MVSFLKENGFPATINIDTKENLDELSGLTIYRSVITDETGNVLGDFSHTDLRARIHWVNGYFTALRNNIIWDLNDSLN